MKIKIFNLFSIGLVSALALSSCSDSFLDDKKNYDNVSTELYDTPEGCQGRLNEIYRLCLPNTDTKQLPWAYTSGGKADDMSKSTEEYSGFGCYVNPQNTLNTISGNAAPDYFFGSANNINANTWGAIRHINDCIEGIQNGALSEANKAQYLGQAYFFRAWMYYRLVKWYGGMPIVDKVLEPVESVVVPRSTTKETVDFIVSDLDKAADLLSSYTENGGWSADNWGKVSTGTALALKGRVLLWWASPIFNRANDESRWKTAYETMTSDLARINSCGYGLFKGNGSNVNGSTFALQFNQTGINPEAVFVVLYNKSTSSERNSDWESGIRPKNTTGSGLNPSAMLVDLFPMADGKRPATADTYTKLDASTIAYDANYPFMNRDPRFYRTFAFPGVRWAYNGNESVQSASANNPSYNDGKDYALWNYVWYENATDAADPESSKNYGADNLLGDVKGMYVRKRSDDLDVNNSALYDYSATANRSGFTYSAQPYIELRYAEVLLNYAEAACGAGHLDVAVEQLKKIRERAGYTADNNYGLQENLSTDQAACMAAILYERQIEFAYEGKRFDDLRRWMLFDGGTGKVDGAPSTWTLTGWGGNTCTWLGFKPLNGQRRENMEFRLNDSYASGGTTFDSDPAKNVERCAAMDLRQDLSEQQETLKAWYEANLVRKTKKGDSWDSNKVPLYMNFLPRYYLLGFARGALNNNSKLEQNIGWEDSNNGGANGTFDPLAE